MSRVTGGLLLLLSGESERWELWLGGECGLLLLLSGESEQWEMQLGEEWAAKWRGRAMGDSAGRRVWAAAAAAA